MQTLKHKISLPQVFPDLCQLLFLWWNSSGLLWGSGAEGRTASLPVSLPSLHLLRFVPGRWASPLRQGKCCISHCTHDLWTWITLLQKQGACMGGLKKKKKAGKKRKPQGDVKVQNLFSSDHLLIVFQALCCFIAPVMIPATYLKTLSNGCVNTAKPKIRVSGLLWFIF